MQRRQFTAALFAPLLVPLTSLAPRAASASVRSAVYQAEHEGVVTRLSIQIDGERVEGALHEGDLQLRLRGKLNAQQLSGRLHEPVLGLPLMRVHGTLAGDVLALTVQLIIGDETKSLRMVRVGAAPAATAAANAGSAHASPARQDGQGQIDPRFVGRWRHESQINSPGGAGGFASFSTVRTMELGADGRVRQWVRSAGGGGDWSHRGGEQIELQGHWQMRGDQLWVRPDGRQAFELGARLRLVDGRLVAEAGGSRRIWQR